MRGSRGTPEELREVIALLEKKQPRYSSAIDASDFQKRKALQERLVLRALAAMVPFTAAEAAARLQAAYAAARAKNSDVFVFSHPPEQRAAVRLSQRGIDRSESARYARAADLLSQWLRWWIECGKVTALLMHLHSEVEREVAAWWSRPKRFGWPQLATAAPPTVLIKGRHTPASIAARAFWTVLASPEGYRFSVCESCNRVFFAATARGGRFCGRKCANAGVRPFRADPEQVKLAALRIVLSQVPRSGDWKTAVLAYPEAKKAGISRHWLTRRFNQDSSILEV